MKERVYPAQPEKIEGYWYSNREPQYPMPVHSDEPFLGKDDILARLAEVETTAESNRFRGYSYCRCCNNNRFFNGCAEFILGDWRWPQGFRHYIEVHNVKPTDAFIAEVLKL